MAAPSSQCVRDQRDRRQRAACALPRRAGPRRSSRTRRRDGGRGRGMNFSFAHPLVLLLLVLPVLLCVWEWTRRGADVVLPFDHAPVRRGKYLGRFLAGANLLPAMLLTVAILVLAG